MTDIGFGAKALNAESITTHNSDIVKHGCRLKEIRVELEFGMTGGYLQSLVCYLPTMHKEDVPQGIILLVKLVYN